MMRLADEKTQLRQVEQHVQVRLGDAVPAAVVQHELRQRLRDFEGAPIRTYVPVLLQKQLLEALRPRG